MAHATIHQPNVLVNRADALNALDAVAAALGDRGTKQTQAALARLRWIIGHEIATYGECDLEQIAWDRRAVAYALLNHNATCASMSGHKCNCGVADEAACN